MSSPRRLVILGLGNVFVSDDGLGAAAVALLERRYQVPEEVSVLDGGTLGLDLVPRLEEADDAILVDAVRADSAPGSIVRLAGEAVPPAVRGRLSSQPGDADLLAGMRLRGHAPRIVLLGLVPASLALGGARSAAVEAALPRLVEAIVEEVRWMGYDLLHREDDETGARPGDSMARTFLL